MKTYKITSDHEVNVDDFEQGEGENVNSYILSEEVKAKNVREAVEKYFAEFLYYDFDFSLGQIDEENNDFFDYSVLVDANNMQPSEEAKKLWKKGLLTLYSNLIRVTVQEIKNVKF